MKKLILAFLFGTISLFAQNKSIEIIYQIKRHEDIDKMVEIMSENSGREIDEKSYRNALINSLNEDVNYSLILTKDNSIYKFLPKIDNSQSKTKSVSYGDEDNVIYKNLKEHFSVKPNFDLGKNYLIRDSLIKFDWTKYEESKDILNKPAFKAVAEDEDYVFEAYYWKDSVYTNGPELVQGLPGLIVELRVNSKKNEKSGIEYRVVSVNYKSNKR